MNVIIAKTIISAMVDKTIQNLKFWYTKRQTSYLILVGGSVIKFIDQNDCVENLGVNLRPTVFNHQKWLKKLEEDFKKMIISPLLQGAKQINIPDTSTQN